jgi:cell division protein FtsW
MSAPAEAPPKRKARTGTRPPRGQQPVEHRILLTVTLCLLAAGAVMVYSASSARNLLEDGGDGTRFLLRYVGYGAVGLLAMRWLSRRPLPDIRALTAILLFGGFGLLVLVAIPGIGVQINGARRWLGAGPLQFQPSEIMKLALVLYAAAILADRPRRLRTVKGILAPVGYVALGACVLVMAQPDMGTALVIMGTMTAMLVAAGAPMGKLGKIGGWLAGGVALLAVVEPYRRERLLTFLDPWKHAADSGFQAVQGQIAIGSGGLTGVGLGQSVQKTNYLPEAHTDFILAVIGEELGVLGICALLILYGLLAYAGLRTARNATGSYAKLLAAGLTSLILCQALLNAFAVLGLAPLTGVPLPFISYGSTNLIVLLAAMGILLNIAGGGSAHLRAVPKRPARDSEADADADRDRRGGDRRARGARARGRRRAAG